jgi:alcohol dehydrogenase class IV
LKEEHFGVGCIGIIPQILERNKVKKVFLVTGSKSFYLSGAQDAIIPLLIDCSYVHFNDFSENPKIEDVIKGVSTFKESKCDIMIAVGGGSSIDMAKLINAIAHQQHNPFDLVTGKESITGKGLPLIAVPTTSGSGSEATHFAVVYVNNIKYSLSHEYILPDYSIVDPSLTYNLPPKLTAVSGFDALSHAVESYWSVKSTEESRKYASRAIEMILSTLDSAVNEPNIEARSIMALAAHLSGKAINITKTTAPHAISYPLTSFFKIPHGYAVALVLGKFFVINSKFEGVELNDPRGKDYLQKIMLELCNLFQCTTPLAWSEKWYELMSTVGLTNDIKSLGICKREDIDRIIDNVNLERLKNNPVKIKETMLKDLFCSDML